MVNCLWYLLGRQKCGLMEENTGRWGGRVVILPERDWDTNETGFIVGWSLRCYITWEGLRLTVNCMVFYHDMGCYITWEGLRRWKYLFKTCVFRLLHYLERSATQNLPHISPVFHEDFLYRVNHEYHDTPFFLWDNKKNNMKTALVIMIAALVPNSAM